MNDLSVRLNEVMLELGLSKPVDLAKFCCVSEGLVSQWFSGATKLGPKPLKAFSRTNFSLDWITDGKLPKYRLRPSNLVTMENQNTVDDAPDIVGILKRIPVVGRVQAGEDGLIHIDEYPAGYGDGYMIWWSRCDNAYALRIRGESMSPRYLPGEFVGVDPSADVTPSDEVIVLLKNGKRMIKRLLWRRDDQACFESVNKDFQNIVLDVDEIEKLHLVLGNIPKAAFRSN